MQFSSSPQHAYNQSGISASSLQNAWSQKQPQLEENLQGGVPAATGQHPWQAQLQHDCSLPVNVHTTQMQNHQVMACRADLMNVEQTAAWVRTMGYCYGWEEAEQYEHNFRDNGIKGYLLESLTLQSLKTDLGISKYGHRLEIMMAIKRLFPKMVTMTPDMVKNTGTNSPSPMLLTFTGSTNVSSPINTFYSPVIIFDTPQSGSHEYSSKVHSHSEGIRSSSSSSTFVNQIKMVSDSKNQSDQGSVPKTEHPYGEIRNFCSNHSGPIPGQKEMPPDVNSSQCDHSKVKRKSKRAGPTNPVEYVTLCEVQIRAGKSVNANVVGELNEGQTVVINQIKGRSGRIVEQEVNGRNTNKGWVTLFTSKGKQRLVEKNVYIEGGQKVLDKKFRYRNCDNRIETTSS